MEIAAFCFYAIVIMVMYAENIQISTKWRDTFARSICMCVCVCVCVCIHVYNKREVKVQTTRGDCQGIVNLFDDDSMDTIQGYL